MPGAFLTERTVLRLRHWCWAIWRRFDRAIGHAGDFPYERFDSLISLQKFPDQPAKIP
jgi:hypothetical protein